ncbi:MAG: Crp/Fnr family transcriptional regulator, partial [Elainellaceae cyanobacterium]
NSGSSTCKGRVYNRLLSALPEKEYQALESHLKPIELPRGKILYEPGDRIEQVYFPEQAMISIVSLMESGATTEIGLIGKEGMVGISVLLGHRHAVNRAIVQVPDGGIQIDADVLLEQFRQGGALQSTLLAYTRAMFMYVSQLAACNRHHKIEQRFARWLLHVSDNIDSDQLPLTQEFIAEMLGSRRSGVTVAAQSLQRSDIIQYRRGVITILDRDRLEGETCECYRQIRNEFSRLPSP